MVTPLEKIAELHSLRNEHAVNAERIIAMESQAKALDWAERSCPELLRLTEWLARLGRGDEALPAAVAAQ